MCLCGIKADLFRKRRLWAKNAGFDANMGKGGYKFIYNKGGDIPLPAGYKAGLFGLMFRLYDARNCAARTIKRAYTSRTTARLPSFGIYKGGPARDYIIKAGKWGLLGYACLHPIYGVCSGSTRTRVLFGLHASTVFVRVYPNTVQVSVH